MITLKWFAPIFSGGGYCSEAISFGQSLIKLQHSRLEIQMMHHGDTPQKSFVDQMSPNEIQTLTELDAFSSFRGAQPKAIPTGDMTLDIIVCHSEPGAWDAPKSLYYTNPCPPQGGSTYLVGRTMFETDRIPNGWKERLNFMDEIWVPTHFSRMIFEQFGVDPSKLQVVGEPVDSSFFAPVPEARLNDPYLLESLSSFISPSRIVGKAFEKLIQVKQQREQRGEISILLFVGKWEERKGVDVLLRSFFKEFTRSDNALLVLLTSAYHSTDRFEDEIERILVESGVATRFDEKVENNVDDGISGSSSVRSSQRSGNYSGSGSESSKSSTGSGGRPQRPEHLTLTNVPQGLMPLLYSLASAVVIPSHGEGWGRPHVEAMSCGVPVIATNWSGPTEYLTEENGYPLRLDPHQPMVPAGNASVWAKQGHLWAQPDEDHLRQLMRAVVSDRVTATSKGKRAREDMIARFSLERMGQEVANHIDRIEKVVLQRRSGMKTEKKQNKKNKKKVTNRTGEGKHRVEVGEREEL